MNDIDVFFFKQNYCRRDHPVHLDFLDISITILIYIFKQCTLNYLILLWLLQFSDKQGRVKI